MAHANLDALAHGLGHLPLGNRSYVVLLAANVGAVIMPWMIFYQQGAVVDKGLQVEDIPSERRDTAVGAILTQLIMLMAVLAFAVTVGLHHPGAVLNTVQQMSSALVPFVGQTGGRVLLAVAVLGASLVAALVASLAGAWGISEALGWSHTLNEGLSRKTAKFYITYILAHLFGAIVVLLNFALVHLVVDVEVMNALLLPIVLGFLLALEATALPPEYRMHGAYRTVTTLLCLTTMAFGLYVVPSIL
jgi:Mn2+/Fe2+ NRAMP family transporter